ncbi:MAG: hypothetical protein ACD_79C01402G0004 [uncultured bacterium]|nr:MAG: hypothetical protein ACD_79C01402G0004 [uncultured bacterium]
MLHKGIVPSNIDSSSINASSITNICDLHNTAERRRNFLDFSGDNSNFSGGFSQEKTPEHLFGAAAREKTAEKTIFDEHYEEIVGIISIEIPNTIHGCKQLNIKGRKK